MTKRHKDYTTKILVLGAIVVIFGVFISVNINKPSILGLSDNDFNILGVTWSNYQLEWRDNGGNSNLVSDLEHPIDWDFQCKYCKTGIYTTQQGFELDYTDVVSKEERCSSSEYYFTTETSKENLIYNLAIDGINIENLRSLQGDMFVLPKGTRTFGAGVYYNGEIISNLDISKSHEFTFCVTDSRTNGNFICKSVTLPAKCT